jgi:hypothetical protein
MKGSAASTWSGGHRGDVARLAGLIAALGQPLDGLQFLVDLDGQHLERDGPPEEALDAVDAVVNDCARQAGLDHLFPDGAQGRGAEPGRGSVGLQFSQGAEGVLEVVQLQALVAVRVAVIPLRPMPVAEDQLGHGQVWRGGFDFRAEGETIRGPIGDELVIEDFAFRAVKLAQVAVLAIEADDGLAGGLVQAVGGGALFHGADPFSVD